MLLTVLATQRAGACSRCKRTLPVWVCSYDYDPEGRGRSGINYQFFCDDDLPGEIEYVRGGLQVRVEDERELPPLDLKQMIDDAYNAPKPLPPVKRRIMPPVPVPEPDAEVVTTWREGIAEHRCHRPGCDLPVPPRLLACRAHWFQLVRAAPELAAAIVSAYRRGQEITKTPSAEYLDAFKQVQNFWLSLNGEE